MSSGVDEVESPSTSSRSGSGEPRRPDRRLLLGLTLSVVFIVGVVAISLIRNSGDGCRAWEAQLNDLSRLLTRHRLAKGREREPAIDAISRLKLPCAKVAKTRDACVEAYLSLLRAEEEQRRAKSVLGDLEKAVLTLDEPWRSTGRLRILDNEPPARIAELLGVDEGQAKRQIDESMAKLGPERLERLHGAFEHAVEASNEHIELGAAQNEHCDTLLKQLVEESQRR